MTTDDLDECAKYLKSLCESKQQHLKIYISGYQPVRKLGISTGPKINIFI
jgi:hypothetical protein